MKQSLLYKGSRGNQGIIGLGSEEGLKFVSVHRYSAWIDKTGTARVLLLSKMDSAKGPQASSMNT